MSDQICGVPKELLERFLFLVRDHYRKADEASFFLEQRTGEISVHGMANLRDVLSHLATFLNPRTTREKLPEQIANAEEHLRRAIIEPYETALNKLTLDFEELYRQYTQRVTPVVDAHPALSGAPNTAAVESRLDEIRDLTSNGRLAKAKNL